MSSTPLIPKVTEGSSGAIAFEPAIADEWVDVVMDPWLAEEAGPAIRNRLIPGCHLL